jgi:hypothetical protein
MFIVDLVAEVPCSSDGETICANTPTLPRQPVQLSGSADEPPAEDCSVQNNNLDAENTNQEQNGDDLPPLDNEAEGSIIFPCILINVAY